ncbi:hypothetical protein DKM44_11445 [Deinococcus irradiatisoli]|uniref:Aminoglycoside phosphotransferase n=1 Tax=Deinococcus irradiatisoli TaxID=2202254 RepID=A0A2Z3JEZ9_9DEIO|nr:hypothetical protein [Deinococcus irradiatisoli]AWN23767.1 hypothetical protein DKM44_11445 [Deinococcus irradiatisoli]
MLKPAGLSSEELEWQAQVLGSVAGCGLRLWPPVRAQDGRLEVEGWAAWTYLPGQHEAGRWLDIIEVGRRLHGHLADQPRPAFLAGRTDAWARADRVAWGEHALQDFRHVRHVQRLSAALRPVTAPCQLIHGDLSGNVLFSSEAPPAVIDFSPYWRPAGYASAVVVADALVWEGAGENLLEDVALLPDMAQYLLRALIFRRVSEAVLGAGEPIRSSGPDPYARAVELACRLAER